MASEAKLQINEGPLDGTKYGFEEPMVCVVGRADDCEILIPREHAPGISKYHCQIKFDEDRRLTVKDLDSRNGTFVNNVDIARDQLDDDMESRRVAGGDEFLLRQGDVVHVGGLCLNVEIVEETTRSEPGKISPSRSEPKDNRATKIVSGHENGDKGGEKTTSKKGTRTRKFKFDDEPNEGKQRAAGKKTLLKIARIERFKEQSMFIPNYKVIRKIGQGSMGLVYLVENKTSGAKEALKLLIPDKAIDDDEKERFFGEIDYLRNLKHPNVVKVFASGVAQGTFYFTMEFCDAGDLDNRVEKGEGPLPYETAFKILLECLNALDYAHSKGLVHRDIKPDNIFLVQRKKGPSAKIGDFGVAKALELAGIKNCEEFVFGTLAYIPRRQIIQYDNITPELDLWSLTASFYFMLTGHTPRVVDMGNPLDSVLDSKPIPISTHNPDVPETMVAFIDDVLANDETFLFKTVKEFRSKLLDFF